MISAQGARLAAIRFDHASGIDRLLELVVHEMRSRGADVRGFLQRETWSDGECCRITYLENLVSGVRHRISQPLGRGSRGCRLDPVAMADLCGPMLSTLEERPDLIVINRFGKGEADGQGFRTVFEKAFQLEIPVLCAVRETYESAWLEFTGGDAQFLPPEKHAVLTWGQAVLAREPSIVVLTEPGRTDAPT